MMPRNTRFRQQELQPAPRLSRRQTRRRQDAHSPDQIVDPPRGNQDPPHEDEPRHTSAIFSFPEISPDPFEEDEPERTSTHPYDDISPPSQWQGQTDDVSLRDIASPTLAMQDTHRPPTAQEESDVEAQQQPGHVRIIHFDFEKYRPSTPGSESHPIKIEDSPSLVQSRQASIRPKSQSIALPISYPDIPAIEEHDHQPGNDASYIEKEQQDPDTSSNSPTTLILLPADLVLSAAVTSIITSPSAATAFLAWFLAAEEQWLESDDDDMDPDIEFWQEIVVQFNAAHSRENHGYNINTWLTARVIATTLCSQPYRVQVEQQQQSHILGVGDEDDAAFSGLLAAINDCRRMSQRRRRERRLQSRNAKASSGDSVDDSSSGRVQEGVLNRMPQTIEEYEELRETLGHICAQSKNPSTPAGVSKRDRSVSSSSSLSKAEPEPELESDNKNRKLKRVHPESPSQTGSLETADGTRSEVPVADNNDAPQVANQKIKRSKKRKKNRPRDRDRYPSSTKERWGDEQCSNPAIQDTQRLEKRILYLERTMKGFLKRPR
ncbi:hypothetical protein HD806DRAFT_501134 [Xylariaceae sp. AK1471]|nr:hypothetical protein HD806DRAFT_501134 [Xylariaceae sp. AK1471]